MDGIRWRRDRDRIFVLGYVVMPDHVHLLMVLRGSHTLQTIIRVWKANQIGAGPIARRHHERTSPARS
jgi:REP element-mobilizing transposase RayT